MNQIVDRVAYINPTKLSWNLVVGVFCLYELCSQSKPADVCSLEMVLQDEHGDRIHCSIPKANIVVAGNKDAQAMVTKAGQQSKCIALYLEDLELNRMKCTLFGEYVDKVISFMDKPENEPDILVAQLFKPHFYLNEVSVQNSLYASQIFFNPDIADVSFKNSLMKQDERASQPISHIDRQPQYSVSHELSAEAFPIKTIEEIINMTTEILCWIVGTIVSIEVGAIDWFYASCKTCPRKVKENKDRYF
ncbi:hypothetical protein Ahy_A04g019383 [Arachis hypogaea]|uniref:Replication protein A 70 kDa DNA-binding subunit B/D first OB fold domain-containing protein n=1 Tax=Arachis hypogaea TaxID=3818 RepID=A0A445DG05_ARAHY|nr:hypothetical protein Ahy_A04g019383 [Arachis hypogaea]